MDDTYLELSKNGVEFSNVSKYGYQIIPVAKENDVVLILGKGAETYQEIKGVKHYYSDYETVDNYFKYSIKEKLKVW